ncbi:MAG TPA: caspase family protein [Herpetosiphonaceae bacterium]|nr:caspase family protein [Herpetosiphonaceae bacterium]
MSHPPSGAAPAIWALLIGIDTYSAPDISPLRGCVNDIEAVAHFMRETYQLADRQIMSIRNQQASRAAILEAFQSFLINNPDIAFGDQILIHFSGHGSQASDPLNIDLSGSNETILAYDSRTPGVFDIPDKTTGALLDALAERKGPNITVIFDCCHSGSGTRLPLPNTPAVRGAAPAGILPAGLDQALLRQLAGRSARPEGSGKPASHVLLAGCRNTQSAFEYFARGAAEAGVWYGALTYFVLQTLRAFRDGGGAKRWTYADLHERVAEQVTSIHGNQTPQCEGQRDRPILGAGTFDQPAFLKVTRSAAGHVTLNAGIINGLTAGDQITLYPPDTRSQDRLPPAVAVVEAETPRAFTCEARVIAQHAAIPIHARGLVTRPGPSASAMVVALCDSAGHAGEQVRQAREALRSLLANGAAAGRIRLAAGPHDVPELVVEVAPDHCVISNPAGEPLARIGDLAGDPHAVPDALEAIARHAAIARLYNRGPSLIQGAISIDLHTSAQALRRDESGALTLEYRPRERSRNIYGMVVANRAPQAVYLNVFLLNPDYSIEHLYPRFHDQVALPAGQTHALPPQSQFEIYLPDDVPSCRDTLKVIASFEPATLDWLAQRGVGSGPAGRAARGGGQPDAAGSPLAALLAQMVDPRQRAARPVRYGYDPADWGTCELSFLVTRAQAH